jgi:hypothetical protein
MFFGGIDLQKQQSNHKGALLLLQMEELDAI